MPIFGRGGSGQGKRLKPARPSADVAHFLVISSGDPVSFIPTDTHQVAVDVFGYRSSSTTLPNQRNDLLTGKTITWSSTSPSVASINGSGLLTAVAVGSTTVTATCEGVTTSKVYTVVASRIPASILLSPLSLDVAESTTSTLQARVFDQPAGGGGLIVGATVTWASSNPAVATVSADSGDPVHSTTVTGVGGVAAGSTATITATSGSVSASIDVVVRGPNTLVVNPATINQLEGTTVATTWTVQDSQGRGISGRTVTVNTTNAAIITAGAVTPSGAVHSTTATLVSNGAADLVGTVSGTGVATVLPCTVLDTPPSPGVPVSLSANPGSISQVQGSTRTLALTPIDNNGNSVANQTVTVVSTDTLIASPAAVTVAGNVHSSVITLGNPGTATLTGRITSVTPNLTVDVPVSSNAPAGAFRSNNFSQYATIQALLSDAQTTGNPNGWWSATSVAGLPGSQASQEVNNTVQMSLMTDGGPPQGSSQYLRYTYPTNRANPLCSDYTIGLNVKYPTTYPEVWVEMYTRFSSNFSWGTTGMCTNPLKAAGGKYIFGRTNVSRFELIVGTESLGYTFGYPGNENWVSQSTLRLTASQYTDGQWHRWRFHFKCGASGRAQFWFDNVKVRDTGTVSNTASNTYGIGIGRNMNFLPVLPADMTLDWGLLQYFINDPGW